MSEKKINLDEKYNALKEFIELSEKEVEMSDDSKECVKILRDIEKTTTKFLKENEDEMSEKQKEFIYDKLMWCYKQQREEDIGLDEKKRLIRIIKEYFKKML